jgi:hypothetical protein
MSNAHRSDQRTERECRAWLTHRLLGLPAQRFAQVINRILKGEDVLIRPAAESSSKRPEE